MEKYLYLLKPSFVDNWVNGGMVPLNNAEYYRRNERKGVFTPDECVTDTSTHDFRKIPKLFEFGDDCNVSLGNFRYELMTPTGPTKEVHYTEMMTITRSFEDGLIFCACDTKSILTAKRFKKSFCVKIINIFELKKDLDEQLGVEGIMRNCEYTKDHTRNTFLKSIKDSWQEEFRIYWPNLQPREVYIKPGTAIEVKL